MKKSHATALSVDQRPKKFLTVASRSRNTNSRRATSPRLVLSVSVSKNILIWASNTIQASVSWHNTPLATLISITWFVFYSEYIESEGCKRMPIYFFLFYFYRYLWYGLLRCHEATRFLHHSTSTKKVKDRSSTQIDWNRHHEMVPSQIRWYHPPRKINLYQRNLIYTYIYGFQF